MRVSKHVQNHGSYREHNLFWLHMYFSVGGPEGAAVGAGTLVVAQGAEVEHDCYSQDFPRILK